MVQMWVIIGLRNMQNEEAPTAGMDPGMDQEVDVVQEEGTFVGQSERVCGDQEEGVCGDQEEGVYESRGEGAFVRQSERL